MIEWFVHNVPTAQQPILSSVDDLPYTALGALLAHARNSDNADWPRAWLSEAARLVPTERPTVGTLHRRRLVRDGCAQKIDYTAATSTGKVKN